MNRRDFIRLSVGSAVFGGGRFVFADPARTPAPVELAADPSPEEIEDLRRRWGFWLDAPPGYSFKREYRLVKRYSYHDYDAELYLQRKIADGYPADTVETSIRYVRYAEQYLVITGIRSRAFAAIGDAENKALQQLLQAEQGAK